MFLYRLVQIHATQCSYSDETAIHSTSSTGNFVSSNTQTSRSLWVPFKHVQLYAEWYIHLDIALVEDMDVPGVTAENVCALHESIIWATYSEGWKRRNVARLGTV